MAVSARRPFDPAGPFVVASQELVTSAGRLQRGAPFPAAGLTEQDLLLLWIALQIDVADAADVPADPDAMTLEELEAATAPAKPASKRPAAARR